MSHRIPPPLPPTWAYTPELVRQLDAEVASGFVRTARHPSVPLTIYTYTAAAQWNHHWTLATRVARGLILDDAGQLVARPFPKFFTYQEHVPEQLPGGEHEVFEKLDGSLVIATCYDTTPVVATRGSFTSPQAVRARRLLQDRLDQLEAGVTYLFEVLYPENRIVVDYGPSDRLVLLAALETATGNELDLDRIGLDVEQVEAHRAVVVDVRTGATPERENREGYVVRFSDGSRVKIKHAGYARAHRLVTGATSRSVWEWMGDGRVLDELLEQVPDHLHGWVQETAAALTEAYQDEEKTHRDAAAEILEQVVGETSRHWALDEGDRCREREQMYRRLQDSLHTELLEMVRAGEVGSVIRDAAYFAQAKDPEKKQRAFEALVAHLRDPAQLGRVMGLAETIAANDDRFRTRMEQERDSLATLLRHEGQEIARRVAACGDRVDPKVVRAIVYGHTYDRELWRRVRPEVTSPFAERVAG